ncbi:MAG TPA: polymer-forming cytoskeletal protein [Longimicrobiaceae bacterium]|nr:polymer-forming cytoskeletal protein [Longimicrobiaceae bacterium]
MSLQQPILALTVFLLALASPLRAQEVRLEGAGEGRAVRLAREILAARGYLRLDRDTVLPGTFRAAGDLVVVDADVRLEGTVEGRVAVLGGVLFVRPGARIGGPVAVVGGEVYASDKAAVGEIVEDSVPQEVAVEFDSAGPGAGVRVIPPPGSGPRLTLPGILGARLPTYDRVNGLTLAAGPAWLISGREGGPRVDAWVSYHTARNRFGGGISARTPVGPGLRLEAGAERGVFTNERWIREDPINTLGALFFANDERDYYGSDRATLSLARVHEEPLIAGEYAFEPRIVIGMYSDRSLDSRRPWSLFGDLDRPNLHVEEEEWASVTLGSGFRWQGGTTSFRGDVQVERALEITGGIGFTQLITDGLWTMQALGRHEVTVRFHATGTLGGDPAPPQRWSFVGGRSTLPTLETAELRGDRLVFIESGYGIPVSGVVLPILGPPTLRFTHLTGMAWPTGTTVPGWVQNLGAGVFFSLVNAELYVDPSADDLNPRLRLGVMLPGL